MKGRPKLHFTGPGNAGRSLIKDEIVAPVERRIKQLGTFLVKIGQKNYRLASLCFNSFGQPITNTKRHL